MFVRERKDISVPEILTGRWARQVLVPSSASDIANDLEYSASLLLCFWPSSSVSLPHRFVRLCAFMFIDSIVWAFPRGLDVYVPFGTLTSLVSLKMPILEITARK